MLISLGEESFWIEGEIIGKRVNAKKGNEDKEVKWPEVAGIALALLDLDLEIDICCVFFVEKQLLLAKFKKTIEPKSLVN